MINKKQSLTPAASKILQQAATEPAHCGVYTNFSEQGTYLCRQCGLALFRSHTKFNHCGWASFDEELADSLHRQPDPDGRRTEICCQRCAGHLGHVFLGEGFTAKNLRHCVNSLALDFVSDANVLDSEEIIVAAGCFWGVQSLLSQAHGVLATEVGYTGGTLTKPDYQQICSGQSGHLEAVRVLYDPKLSSHEELYKLFFEIHDFSQTTGQGPNQGSQYLSAIFYYSVEQQTTAHQLIEWLVTHDLSVATQIRPTTTFWPAETHHQHYYQKNNQQPYCHVRRRLF